MTQPSSSQSFWAEALEVAESLEKRLSPASQPPPSPDHPPPRKRVRYALSPDTSDVEPNGDDDGGDKGDPSSSSPPQDSSTTTLQYLPDHRTRLLDGGGHDAVHDYLAAAEYSGVSFGDFGDYMRKKDIKIQTQNASIAAAAADRGLAQIFANLTFYINGNTHPPMEELRRMILQRGGKCIPYIRAKTGLDFIIAPVLTLAKFREFKAHKLVREAWIVACAEQGKLLDWRRWRLRVDDGEARLDGFVKAVESGDAKVDTADQVAESPQGPTPRPMPVTTQAPIAATQSLLQPVRAAAQRPSTQHPNPRLPAIPTRVSHRSAGPVVPLPQPPNESIQQSVAAVDDASKDDAPDAVAAADPAKAINTATRPEGAWDNYFVHKSNVHAAELMKSEEFRARHTSERGNEAGFIDQFFENSRLHHLSTWKTELRVLVAKARDSAHRVPTVLAQAGAKRVYLHVDFDAFFVSAGVSSRPHLRGKPVVVCHSSKGGRDSTSEVASASYEARAKGVKNGMSLGRARQLVGAELETIPYEFETYRRHSEAFYTVLLGYADELEAVSVDEALLDVTGAVTAISLAPEEAGATSSDPAIQLGDRIRADIRGITGCEVSIGISHNLLLARLATKKAKPAGIFHLRAEEAPAFLAPLDVDQLPSVGHSTRAKMQEAFGSTLCGDLLAQNRSVLRKTLGPKTGDTIYNFLRGNDDRRLQPDKERKSVSAEMNYGIRFQNQDQADRYVADLGAEVAKRLRSVSARGGHITLKIMTRHPDAPVEPPKFLGHGKCETVNRSGTFGRPTDDAETIGREAVRLLNDMNLDPVELRGVGIQITKLETGMPKGQSMLSFARPVTDKVAKVDTVIDEGVGDDGPLGNGTVSEERSGETTRTASPVPLVVDPQSNHIDSEWLAGLPLDIRQEFEEQHGAMGATKRRQPEEAPAPPKATKSTLRPEAHITRQLRPKLKTQMGVKDIAARPLYGAWARAGGGQSRDTSLEPVRPPKRTREDSAVASEADSDIELLDPEPQPDDMPEFVGAFKTSDLRALGIDLDFISALPDDMQAEIVQSRRDEVQRQQAMAQARARTRTRVSASISPSHRRPGAGSRSPSVMPRIPAPRASVVKRPALLGACDTADVAQVLAKWVKERPSPANEDVARISKYLVKCVTGSMGGIDHVGVLLRGMRGLLRDLQRGDETPAEGEAEDGARDCKAWWAAFEEMKCAVDVMLVARMGAPLGL